VKYIAVVLVFAVAAFSGFWWLAKHHGAAPPAPVVAVPAGNLPAPADFVALYAEYKAKTRELDGLVAELQRSLATFQNLHPGFVFDESTLSFAPAKAQSAPPAAK